MSARRCDLRQQHGTGMNGSYIGRYRIEGTLGEGASGIVRRAYDPLMDRTVAIKSVKSEAMNESEIARAVSEFHHEARIAGKYAHDNIVTIYDVVTYANLDHIVMEYVAGRSILDYLISTGPMAVDETLAVVHKCAVALAYIHYHGVIHRDVKPGNIMYHPAQRIVKLMDFSVAHNIEETPIPDIGTIAYMAPEHFDKRRRITQLTDIFALGSTMYRMLAKRYPFTRDNTAYQIMHLDPVPVEQIRPEIPTAVSAIVNRAMAKADADRYQSAAECALEVEQVMHELYPGSDLMDPSDQYLRR